MLSHRIARLILVAYPLPLSRSTHLGNDPRPLRASHCPALLRFEVKTRMFVKLPLTSI